MSHDDISFLFLRKLFGNVQANIVCLQGVLQFLFVGQRNDWLITIGRFRLRRLGCVGVLDFALYRFFKNDSLPLQVAVELVPVSLMLRQFKYNLGDNRPDSPANLFEATQGERWTWAARQALS